MWKQRTTLKLDLENIIKRRVVWWRTEAGIQLGWEAGQSLC